MIEKTILYVEDNFHNRRIVRKILERQGYTIHEAEDGIKGFNMLQELAPPVVLLDISLPGMDGIEIAKNVKADDDLKHIILIALTASAMQGDRERFLAAGCDDYLSKPFKAVGLVEMVNHHFDNLPEQPVKIEAPKEEWPPLPSEEQEDDTVEFAVPDLENIDSTKSFGELPEYKPLVKKKEAESITPVEAGLDADDQATPVCKEIVEQESKQEALADLATPVEVNLDADDQATPVSKEIVEQESKQEEPTEPVAPIEAKTSAEGNTKPLNELEVAAHEYLEKEEGVPTIEILAQPKELEVKPVETEKAEILEKAKPKAKPKFKAKAKTKTTKAKPKAKPKTKAKAKAKTTKAKPKAKPKTKAKAKAKTTKAKPKAKPKTKAKAKAKTTKSKAQGKKKQAEKADPVQTSLKADDRTRPLWAPIITEVEIVPASESIKSSPPSKSERKANETEGAPIEEIMDNIVGIINSKTIKPVDPNGSLSTE